MTPPPPATAELCGFPDQFARTLRFSLGVPHSFTVSPDGARVLFLRSVSGADPRSLLWSLDPDGTERPLPLPPVPGAGVGAYTTDAAAGQVAYALDGALWTVAAEGSAPPSRVPAAGPVHDPRLSPDGRRIAYVSGGDLRLADTDGAADRLLVAAEGPDVAYGLPDYVTASEIGRTRGYWWSPDGDALLVTRVDSSGVGRRWLADPAHPGREPRVLRYARAGTPNAVTLLYVLRLDAAGEPAGRVPVALPERAGPGHPANGPWTAPAFEYVTAAGWDAHGPYAAVQSRDQRTHLFLAVDPADGSTAPLDVERDEQWVALLPGAPARTASGAPVVSRLLPDGTRGLAVGPVTSPPGLQVREVLGVEGERVLLRAGTEPTEVHVWEYRPGRGFLRIGEEPGVHDATARGGTLVLDSATLAGRSVRVLRGGLDPVPLTSYAEEPLVTVRPRLLSLGARQLRSALFLPSWHTEGSGRLPVLLCPYGGAGLALVVRARMWWTTVAQWFAEQGYAVLITDGRGTPGRGGPWEKAVFGDRLTAVLEDQVDALRAAAAQFPDLDLGRVGIRGSSYGGYLSAAAVLRHPEVFHAAVATAAPTDRRLYDTHWEERFLGHPEVQPENYRGSSLLDDAPRLSRPLLLVHGLADDNVTVAHMLRFSAALLAAGRPHQVLPLSGVGHATTRGGVGGALLRHELAFLTASLGGERAAD